MNNIVRRLVLIAALFASQSSFAEGGCPNGESPIGPRSEANPLGCIIDHSLNQSQAQPRGYWQNRYAAIAIGNLPTGGTMGASTNKTSKRAAEKSAKSQCKANGAKDCKIVASYYNQCAAVAWGLTGSVAWTGAGLDNVTKKAMSDCSQSHQQCRIYYSNCVEPVWIQ